MAVNLASERYRVFDAQPGIPWQPSPRHTSRSDSPQVPGGPHAGADHLPGPVLPGGDAPDVPSHVAPQPLQPSQPPRPPRAPLDHPARDRLLTAVEQHPGIHRHALARTVGLSLSATAHHLRVLEARGHILTQASGKAVHHYPAKHPPLRGDRPLQALLSLDRKRAVAEAVAARPGAIRAEVAEALRISRSTLSWHVQRLVDEGLVVEVENDRRRELHPTEGLLRFLQPWAHASVPAGPVPV